MFTATIEQVNHEKMNMYAAIAKFFDKATTVLVMVADKIAHDAANGR